MIWEGLILAFPVVHASVVIVLHYGWYRVPKLPNSQLPSLSILVPVRNESLHLDALLQDLEKQDYPKDKMEIIVVNDHSTDDTATILANHRSRFSYQWLNLPNGVLGKKQALEMGVEAAKGAFILATDGDCRVGSAWARTFGQKMGPQVHLLFGPVKILSRSWFERIQALDFSILVGYAASLVKFGKPSMSNGANLAYRRATFLEVQGYQGNREIPTGDDEFLLLKIARQYPDGIRFLKHPQAVVTTAARPTFASLLQQRKRWLSKWRSHKNGYIMASVLLILLDNLALVAGWALLLVGWVSTWFVLLFFIRTLVKFNFSYSVNRLLGCRTPLYVFVVYELIYPLYIILLSFASIFDSYTWKGRRYS